MFGLVWKVTVTVATLVGGVLAQRALSTGWRAATGHQPPDSPESPDTGLVEAVVYATVAGAFLNLVRVLAIRQAANYYARRTGGQLPSALVPKAMRGRG